MTDCILPENFQLIFNKPGLDWSVSDVYNVKEWLNMPDQRHKFLRRAAHKLKSTLEDAADVWQSFNVYSFSEGQHKWDSELDGVIRNFNPNVKNARPFCTYLFVCYGRFCKTQKQKQSRQKAPFGVLDDPTIIEGVKDTNPSNDAVGMLENKERREHLLSHRNKLPEKYRDVIILYYFKELKIKEIAQEIKITEGNVKVRLNRARQMLKEELENCSSSICKDWLIKFRTEE